jgi:NADPH-dependent 2,4-dienoyl-CoA reductase/sulfur reductase-like enzyme/peroxiredoxin family protein/rhodanese-related sulfurtransferase/TusA-related sulfurtransferase
MADTVKVVIVGGVAGGASTAARLRRLNEEMEIVLLERGEHISYANCGLPYYIGEVIKERDSLFVVTPQKFRDWFNIDIRLNSEALAIDRSSQQVEVLNRLSGEKYRERYDYLVLSPGAEPIRPPLPGIENPAIFTLRNVSDTDRIYNFIRDNKPSRAAVVGGGSVGLEMCENLQARGMTVTLVELAPQVLPFLDQEMAALVQQYLRARGVNLYLNDAVTGFNNSAATGVSVSLQSGRELQADMVILAIGVKPETKLAREAGLEVGKGIKVNEYLQTSDPKIYALGDAVEVVDFVTGTPNVIPLAGPANKQGRIVANNISGRREKYRGTQGTAVLKVFDLTVAATGASERSLKQAGLEYKQCIVQPGSHAGYYPGSNPIVLKLLFSPGGKIYGAQAVGYGGVDKRIDVIATALRSGKNIYDLQALELAYAPPFSSAKDPVNMAGYVAGNILQGDVEMINCDELLDLDDRAIKVLDVREPEEYMLGHIPGSVNIPLGQLRRRMGELSPEQELVVNCAIGLRSYLAARILMQRGFTRVRSLNGGYRIYRVLQEEKMKGGRQETLARKPEREEETPELQPEKEVTRLDLCGLQCPGPIMEVFRKIKELPEGELLEVCATDPAFLSDIESWCKRTGNTLLHKGQEQRGFLALIRKGSNAGGNAAAAAGSAAETGSGGGTLVAGSDKTLVVFSSDLDRAIAAFIIANGAASMGRKVTMFFTFWGLNILRKGERVAVRKPLLERMFGAMMPRGSRKLALSRMNMLGLGPRMIRRVMAGKNVESLEALMQQALALGVRLVACRMSMEVMGIRAEELIDGVELAGVASYLDAAESSNVNLFI